MSRPTFKLIPALLALGILTTLVGAVQASHPERDGDNPNRPPQFRFVDFLQFDLHPTGDQNLVYSPCGVPLPPQWATGVENWDSPLPNWSFEPLVCTFGNVNLQWETGVGFGECGSTRPACGFTDPDSLVGHGAIHYDTAHFDIYFDRDFYPMQTSQGQVQTVAHEWGHTMSLDEHTQTTCAINSVMGVHPNPEDVPCYTAPTAFDLTSVVCQVYGINCDIDADAYNGSVEIHVVTDYRFPCGFEAWPADINNDSFSDIADIAYVAGWFGKAVPPAPIRYDVAPSRSVDISDISEVSRRFGKHC